MANKVRAIVIGGTEQTFDNVETVQDIIAAMDLDNPSVKVNGQTASSDTYLEDYNYVSFGEKVKGGM